MTSGHDEIRDSLERALQALAVEKGAELVGKIRPILEANLDRGRIEYSTEGRPKLILEYVWLVAERFTQDSKYLYEIQTSKSTEVWDPLFIKMQTWAYNFLTRKGLIPGPRTQEIAVECATEATLSLTNAHFPYDIVFDAWAHIIVQNVCRKYFRRAMRKSAIPEDNLVDLDDALETLVDPAFGDQTRSNDLIMDAISQLSEARRRAIEAFYFEGLSHAEIAKEMNKTVGAIYSLLFNALQDLRKILNNNGNNINE